MEDICVIMNPHAGAAGALTDLRALIDGQASIVLRMSTKGGHARDLAAGAVEEGFEIVVAAGGDGTIHEVVNGIMDSGRRDSRLGIIPLGTGNDLARTLAIPTDPRDALALLFTGRTVSIDLIRADAEGAHRFIVNAAAGGFSGQVDEVLSSGMKSQWGPFAYLMGAVSVLPDLTGYHTTISYDGGPHEEVIIINAIVANGRTVAGGKRVAPLANPQDGLLDLVLIEYAPVLKLAKVGAHLLSGNYLEEAHVLHRQVRSVEIVSEPGMWFNLDGELFTKEPISFQAVPGVLPVIVGADYQAEPSID